MTSAPAQEPEVILAVPGGEAIPEGPLRAALAHLLRDHGVEAGELSVTFLADGPIRELNRAWLAHDWVPDVLSFPLSAPLLGDVYVGWEQARRQADELGISHEEELVRLAIHGTLHLLGHDHPEDAAGREGAEMTRVQEAAVRRVLP